MSEWINGELNQRVMGESGFVLIHLSTYQRIHLSTFPLIDLITR